MISARRFPRTLILATSAFLLTLCLAAGGCAPRRPASAWTTDGIRQDPWYVSVCEGRDLASGGSLAGPERLLASGDTVNVGQGDIIINLQLYRGVDFDALRPYIDTSPAAAFSDAAFDAGLIVQARWNAAGSGQSADRMTFHMKKGAPLGNGTTLAEDYAVTLERRIEPHFSVTLDGNAIVRTPYDKDRRKYDLAPGKYVFRFAFTKDMDRKSVEAVITEAHPAAKLQWSGSRRLAVTEDLKASDRDFVSFTADGALDRDGMPVWGDEALLVAVRQPLRIVAMPVTGGAAAEPRVIATLLPGQTPLAVSDDGLQVIAAESPYGLEESGDGPLTINPWLYRPGAAPLDLTPTLGRVHKAGFAADGRIWIVRNGVFYQAVDASGRTVAELKSSQITATKYPPGWAISGDGRVVAALARPANGQEQGWSERPIALDLLLAKAGSGEVIRLASYARMPDNADFLGGLVLPMALSHDGGVLAFADYSEAPSRLYRVDTPTGVATPVMPVASYSPLVLSPDGTLALCKDRDGNWVVVTLADGIARILPADVAAFGLDASAAFSPDGRYLACTMTTAGGVSSGVSVYDTTSGAISELGSGVLAGWSPDGTTVLVARP